MHRQRLQCLVRCGPCASNRGIPFALAVARIINQQKAVARISILRDEPCPVERERAVAAKCHPDVIWQSRATAPRKIKCDLLPSACPKVEFDAVLWPPLSISRIVGARVVEHRVLPEVEKCHAGKKGDANQNQDSPEGPN